MPSGKIKSVSDALSVIAQGLKTSAVRPNIYGYEPHPKQVIFHNNNARGRLFIGGNRSGKTVAGATESVYRSLGKHPFRQVHEPPTHGRIVAVDLIEGVGKIVKPEIARWMPLSEIKGGSWDKGYSKEERTLYLENGSDIEFMSYEMELEKFAGTSRHWVWFDEEPPEDIWKECLARLIDTKGDWWISMTPVEGLTWTYESIYLPAKSNPSLMVVEVDMTDNPTISPAEIDQFMSGLSKDEIEARIHGKYIQVGGLIYGKYLKENNILDPFIPPKDWLWVSAMDAGYRNPTVFLWAAVDPEGRIFVFDEHYEAEQLPSYHAQVVHFRNMKHGRDVDYYVGDPSIRNVDPITGTSVLMEYVNNGIPIVLGNNDQKAGIQRVQEMLQGRVINKEHNEPNLFITSNCVHLLEEMPRLRWAQWAIRKHNKDRNAKEEQHKRNDHACDALRYLVSSRPKYDTGGERPATVTPDMLGVEVSESVGVHRYAEVSNRKEPALDSTDFTLGNDY